MGVRAGLFRPPHADVSLALPSDAKAMEGKPGERKAITDFNGR